MTNREFFIQCWRDEYPVFVKVLNAVPGDRLDYRPGPTSRSAADLVWLQVLEKQCWFELLETGTINWRVPPPPVNLKDMISAYEKAHAELAPLLHKLDDKSWDEKPTQFVMDGRVFFETYLGHMFWLGLFDAIHHRGQLSVYIRATGGKVPAIYGPSGDDEKDLHTPYFGQRRAAMSMR
jgi:uncharacterized damage-inducible protein DinB